MSVWENPKKMKALEWSQHFSHCKSKNFNQIRLLTGELAALERLGKSIKMKALEWSKHFSHCKSSQRLTMGEML